MTTTWEYKLIEFHKGRPDWGLVDLLNKHGLEGWEAIWFSDNGGLERTVFLKRQVPVAAPCP